MAGSPDSTLPAGWPPGKALPEAMGLSLRAPAQRSGVSAPLPPQVERGEASPAPPTPARMRGGPGPRTPLRRAPARAAGALGRGRAHPRRGDGEPAGSLLRRGEGRRGGAGGHRYEVLTPPLPGLRAEVTRHSLEPGAVTGGP